MSKHDKVRKQKMRSNEAFRGRKRSLKKLFL